MIESFSILGLHGERDVTINFEKNKPYKILVATNGYGKTSILNTFYAILAKDIRKLKSVNFKRIEIKFWESNDTFVIERENLFKISDITKFVKESGYRFGHIIRKMESQNDAESMINSILSEDFEEAEMFINELIPIRSRRLQFIMDLHRFILDNNYNDWNSNNPLNQIANLVSKEKLNILYLPTYRRVEESLENLYPRRTQNDDIPLESINFGMNDVEIKINNLTEKILNSLRIEFQKLNGQILSQLITNEEINHKEKLDEEIVKVILDRLPNESLSNNNKDKILQAVTDGDIYKNRPLYQFLISLTYVYSQQKEYENLIMEFISKCNQYLVNKEIIYDVNKVEVRIIRTKNQQEIKLHMLSSGEKQLVSLFAQIFLEKEPNMVIFFDEPELSLSIKWQKMILKDIITSQKCKFLFATTHSPFIFDQLIEYTSDLREYSTEI